MNGDTLELPVTLVATLSLEGFSNIEMVALPSSLEVYANMGKWQGNSDDLRIIVIFSRQPYVIHIFRSLSTQYCTFALGVEAAELGVY